MPVGVIVALAREAHTLNLKSAVMGKIVENEGAYVCISGMGAEHAGHAAKILIERGATALISWGCAGGLVENLPAGMLLVPAKVRGADHVEYMVDGTWRNRVLQTLSIAPDERTLVESANVLEDADSKKQLATISGAAATDMESAAILRIAQRYGVPGLVLRAVADTCHDRLPQSLNGVLNPLGEVHGLRFASKLLLRPSDIPSLLTLRTRFKRAAATLRRTRLVLGAHFSFIE